MKTLRDIVIKLEEKLGQEWVEIDEPETLSIVFGNLSNEEEDFVLATQTCYISDLPWEDPFVFENVIDALNGNPVIPDIITKPEIEDIMYGVCLMRTLKNIEFSDEIKSFVASVAMNDGFVFLPKELSFAQDKMKPHPVQKCLRENSCSDPNLIDAFNYQNNLIYRSTGAFLVKLEQDPL